MADETELNVTHAQPFSWWNWDIVTWVSDDPLENVENEDIIRIGQKAFRLITREGYPDNPRYVLQDIETGSAAWLTFQAAYSLLLTRCITIENHD